LYNATLTANGDITARLRHISEGVSGELMGGLAMADGWKSLNRPPSRDEKGALRANRAYATIHHRPFVTPPTLLYALM